MSVHHRRHVRHGYEYPEPVLLGRTAQEAHHLLRKSGHFLGYGTLCVLFLRAWLLTLAENQRLTERGYWNDAVMDKAATHLLVSRSSPSQPPQVYLADAGGKRVSWIEENRLDASHPYAPYLAAHRPVQITDSFLAQQATRANLARSGADADADIPPVPDPAPVDDPALVADAAVALGTVYGVTTGGGVSSGSIAGAVPFAI